MRVEEEGERGVVRVQDNGMGISPSSLPHIFDLFTQEPRSLDRAQGGLGIGLSLVKRLVEMHGGEVEAYSAGTGAGSEFVVRLPLMDLDSSEHVPQLRICEEPEAVQAVRQAKSEHPFCGLDHKALKAFFHRSERSCLQDILSLGHS